jgi:hypothetical protein
MVEAGRGSDEPLQPRYYMNNQGSVFPGPPKIRVRKGTSGRIPIRLLNRQVNSNSSNRFSVICLSLFDAVCPDEDKDAGDDGRERNMEA